jgi:lipopolysaccharide biosynthesis regulator YciM
MRIVFEASTVDELNKMLSDALICSNAASNTKELAATDSQHPQTEICPHWISGDLCIWEGFRGVRQGCDFIAPCKLSVVGRNMRRKKRHKCPQCGRPIDGYHCPTCTPKGM